MNKRSFSALIGANWYTMEILEKNPARKNTKISFRTDDATLTRLKAVCRSENKTISALIEDVLTEHVLCQENPMPSQDEKRQCPRKQCSVSAVIFSNQNGKTVFSNGIIVNISCSSMQILVKKTPQNFIYENGFEILFSFPSHEYPMLLPCRFVRANHILDESMIVAHFECTSTIEENILRNFITNNSVLNDNSNKKKQR